jgi:hypothetical protein
MLRLCKFASLRKDREKGCCKNTDIRAQMVVRNHWAVAGAASDRGAASFVTVSDRPASMRVAAYCQDLRVIRRHVWQCPNRAVKPLPARRVDRTKALSDVRASIKILPRESSILGGEGLIFKA